MTMDQFHAIYAHAPIWLAWLMVLAFHLALRRVDLVNLRFADVVGDRIISQIRKTDTDARSTESASVDFPIHPDVAQVIRQARVSSLAAGGRLFVIHRTPRHMTGQLRQALKDGHLDHPAQVRAEYASKAFKRARDKAARQTHLFTGMSSKALQTIHEIRSLASHQYALAGFELDAVQQLMAHTDPEMTRAYQRGHARKVIRVDMILPVSLSPLNGEVRDVRAGYRLRA